VYAKVVALVRPCYHQLRPYYDSLTGAVRSHIDLVLTIIAPAVDGASTLTRAATEAAEGLLSKPSGSLAQARLTWRHVAAAALAGAALAALLVLHVRPKVQALPDAESCHWLNTWWAANTPNYAAPRLRMALIRAINEQLRIKASAGLGSTQVRGGRVDRGVGVGEWAGMYWRGRRRRRR
jgi:hypothetical protein